MGSNPSGGTDVSYQCCALPDRGLCDELITRPEGSYRLWCVVVCDLENHVNEEALANWRAVAPKTNKHKQKTDGFRRKQIMKACTLRLRSNPSRGVDPGFMGPEAYSIFGTPLLEKENKITCRYESAYLFRPPSKAVGGSP